MTSLSLRSFLFSLLAGLVVALTFGMLLAWSSMLGRLWNRRPLLDDKPIDPRRQAPWGFHTVAVVFFVYMLVNIGVARGYAAATGRKPMNPVAEKATNPVPATTEQTYADMLLQLALINGLLIWVVPAAVKFTSGATLEDLGIRGENWKGQMKTGFTAALVFTPAVYAIQGIATRVWQPQEHPVEKMILDQFTVETAFLALVSTVILAPLIEELLFRAIIQRWLTRLFRAPDPIPARPSEGGAEEASTEPWDSPGLPLEAAGSDPYVHSQPTTSSLVTGESRAPGRTPILAILTTSVLFASLHYAQWPAPIAIFLLSMALGTLFQQTGSLLASVTMHATFNGMSTLLLLLGAIGQPAHDAAPQVVPAEQPVQAACALLPPARAEP